MTISHTKRQILKEHRNSCPKMFCKKDVLRNFIKLTRKELCQSLYFNEVETLRPVTLLKGDSGTGVFLWHLRSFWEHLFLQNLSGGCFYKQLILPVCRNFVLSRAPQIPWQKHTSEHLYRTAPSGCFQTPVIFLKKGKTGTIFHTSSDLNALEIL